MAVEFTIPNAPETTHQVQAWPDRGDYVALTAVAESTGVSAGCAVTASGTPDLNTHVAAGTVYVVNVAGTVAGGALVHGAADPTNPRIDLVVANSAGAISVLAGTAATTPLYSASYDPAVHALLAAVLVQAAATTITAAEIIDKRVVYRPKIEKAGDVMSGTLDMGTNFIINVTDPANPQDAATRAWVLAQINALDAKDPVAYCSTTALPSNVYANGSSGVGATLTASANGFLIVDGVTVDVTYTGQRVLVAGEATQANNGWYVITNPGGLLAKYVLTRATDSDQAAEIGPGYITAVIAPTGLTVGANNGKAFLSSCAVPFVVGTTALTFSLIGAAYQAGAGLTLTGVTFSIGAGQIVSSMILDGTVANADLANMANKTYKGRHTAGSGVPEDVSTANMMADLSGSAAAAFSFNGQQVNSMAAGVATTDGAVIGQLTGIGVYGDSSDGIVTIGAGTTTLAADKMYLNLTVTGTLVTSGFRVYASGTIAGAGVIQANGANASGATAGAGASGIAGTISGGAGGGNGTSTGNGNNGTSLASSALGGGGGAGGNGTGGRTGGSGGTVTTNPANVGLMRHVPMSVLGIFLSGQGGTANLATTNALLRSGAGGGGGAGDGTNAGGGGGAGGHVCLVAGRNFDFSSGLVIQAKGGNGANGVAGNSGGGGGGGGGVILITYSTTIGYVAGTNTVVTGGTKGNLTGVGSTNGVDGSGGLVITVLN